MDPAPAAEHDRESTSDSRKSTERQWSPRYTTALIGCLGMVIQYSQSVNLSVAIVAMVATNDTSKAAHICPNYGDYNMSTPTHKGEFAWSKQTQGVLLSSFFWGCLTTNVLGGRASEYLGGKLVFGLGILSSSIVSLLSPLCVFNVGVFIACRILLGMAQGVTFPAMNTILASWYLPLERSRYTTFVLSGIYLGTVVGITFSGLLASSTFLKGWPATFYVFGWMGVVWSFAWYLLVYDRPQDHPNISSKELSNLRDQQDSLKQHKIVAIPWKEIMMSSPFWAIVAGSLCHHYAFYTLLTVLPTYLHDVQRFELIKNGFLSSLPSFLMWAWSLMWAATMDWLASARRLTIVGVRRISMVVGLYGPMLALVTMLFVQCNAVLVVMLLCASGMLSGAVTSGYLCSFQDIAPNLAGTLTGVTNTLASITGIVSPSITGYITQNNETLWAWRAVFLISAGLSFVFCTIYLIFISADVQSWNEPKPKDVAVGRNEGWFRPAADHHP